MYYITDMSALQTKNIKTRKFFIRLFGLKNREIVRNISPYAPGNENLKIKNCPSIDFAPSVAEWIQGRL
jgi:hypothetical protein